MISSELEILESLKQHFNARAEDWGREFSCSEDGEKNRAAIAKASAQLADSILDFSILKDDDKLLTGKTTTMTGNEMVAMRRLMLEQFGYFSGKINSTEASQVVAAVGKSIKKLSTINGARSADKSVTKTEIKYPR